MDSKYKTNMLSKLIGQQLKQKTLEEKERILREAGELAARDFNPRVEKLDLSRELFAQKALDRIKLMNNRDLMNKGKNKKKEEGSSATRRPAEFLTTDLEE